MNKDQQICEPLMSLLGLAGTELLPLYLDRWQFLYYSQCVQGISLPF